MIAMEAETKHKKTVKRNRFFSAEAKEE